MKEERERGGEEIKKNKEKNKENERRGDGKYTCIYWGKDRATCHCEEVRRQLPQ